MQPARYYIGGGNIAGILKVSPFRTPLDEYHVITGTSPDLDRATANFFKRRKAMEPYVAAMLEERDFAVVRQNHRYTDPEYPFMRAEIDAQTLAGGYGLDNCEFKTVHPLAAKQWGLDGSDESVPAYVTAQAQWGLGIVRRIDEDELEPTSTCRVVAAIGFDDARVYRVDRADDVIAWARAEAKAFWENHVLKMVPPAPINVDDILNYITPDPTKSIEATDIGLDRTVIEYLELRDAYKTAEKRADAVKAEIQMKMVDATTLTLEGKPVITWNQNRDSVVVDYKAIASRLATLVGGNVEPLYSEHTDVKPGARVFRVKSTKN